MSCVGIKQAPDRAWYSNMRNIFGLSVQISSDASDFLRNEHRFLKYCIRVSAIGTNRLALRVQGSDQDPHVFVEHPIDPFALDQFQRSACFPRLQFNMSNDTNATKRRMKSLFWLKVSLVAHQAFPRDQGDVRELISIQSHGIRVFPSKQAMERFLVSFGTEKVPDDLSGRSTSLPRTRLDNSEIPGVGERESINLTARSWKVRIENLVDPYSSSI